VDRREIITGVIEPPQSNTGSNIMMSNLSASLFGTQTAEVQTENTQQQASVEITKHADKDEVQPGSNVTYAIRIRNMSDETLKNIQVVDRFPENAITIIDAGNGMIEKEGIFWSLLELKPHTQWSGTYQVRTAQSLKHGDVIQTITEAHVGENVIGQLVSKTNVITELPQAGEGPISRAFENAQETLQPVQKAQAYNESAIALPTKSPNKLPRIFWLLTIFAGAVLGICVGIRWPRKKHC